MIEEKGTDVIEDKEEEEVLEIALILSKEIEATWTTLYISTSKMTKPIQSIIDTGAQFTCMSKKTCEDLGLQMSYLDKTNVPRLGAAGNKRINVHGTATMTIERPGGRTIVAKVAIIDNPRINVLLGLREARELAFISLSKPEYLYSLSVKKAVQKKHQHQI